jgi:hypothetical protein
MVARPPRHSTRTTSRIPVRPRFTALSPADGAWCVCSGDHTLSCVDCSRGAPVTRWPCMQRISHRAPTARGDRDGSHAPRDTSSEAIPAICTSIVVSMASFPPRASYIAPTNANRPTVRRGEQQRSTRRMCTTSHPRQLKHSPRHTQQHHHHQRSIALWLPLRSEGVADAPQ